MDNTYEDPRNERNDKRKLWLLTLIVLLLGVSTVGVAYAYTGDYTLNGNEVDTEHFMLVQTDSEMNRIDTVLTGTGADLDIYTKITDGTVSMYSGGADFTREFYITVVTDKDCQFTVSTVVTGDEFTDKLFTINAVDDVVVDGNTATRITVTFTPLADVNLADVCATDTTDIANIADVQAEIESHTFTLTVSAEPISA